MSPLDEELRAALTSRAVRLTPAPDPLEGIEARAGQLRRRRLAGQVAGTALAVALLAVGVPAAIGSVALAPPSPELAATSTAPAPSVTPVPRDPFVLDPAQPWELRGDADLVDARRLADWYALAHGDGWTVTPLWAQTYEGTGLPEIALLAVRGDQARWGVVEAPRGGAARRATSRDSFQEVADLPVPSGSKALMTVLPGDEAPRLLVVAAPQAADVQYSLTGSAEAYGSVTPGEGAQRGIGLVPLAGADLSRDRVRVLAQDGDAPGVVAELPAPDPAPALVPTDPPTGPAATPTRGPDEPRASSSPATPRTTPPAPATPAPTTPPATTPPAAPPAPANLLGWPARGTTPSASDLAQARRAYASVFGRADEADDVQLDVLYAGSLERGTRFLVGQAWFPGEPARSYGWAAPTEAGDHTQISPPTEAGTVVLAFLITGLESDRDTLVVVPQPRTGQVEYGDDDATEFRAEGDVVDGAWIIDRDPRATTDQLRVLDGDGDLDDPTYQGPVSLLLCGVDSCS